MSHTTPIGLKIAVIDRAFKRKMDERVFDMGLTSVQLRVLAQIHLLEASGVEEIHQRDLEKVEKISHPAMTGIIKRLENKGFVTCSPSPRDKRYKKITCTDKSSGIHDEIKDQGDEVLLELCKGLSREEIETFLFLTDHIFKNLNNEDV